MILSASWTVPLFQRLARMRREMGTAGLGQEALSGMLFKALSAVVEEDVCRELLVYDWLASGHQFFKTALFYPFSGKTASFLTGAAQPCVLAFTAQRVENLFRLQKVVVFVDNERTDGSPLGREK